MGELTNLRHFNSQPVCKLYGHHSNWEVAGKEQLWAGGAVGQGPTIALNLLRPDGSYVGYRYAAWADLVMTWLKLSAF